MVTLTRDSFVNTFWVPPRIQPPSSSFREMFFGLNLVRRRLRRLLASLVMHA